MNDDFGHTTTDDFGFRSFFVISLGFSHVIY